MDEGTFIKICKTHPILKFFFCGLTYMKKRDRTSNIRLKKQGDYIIINTDATTGQHWFLIIKKSATKNLLFDSTNGIGINKKDCRILSRNIGGRVLEYDYERANKAIQTAFSLTCGEHCIGFLLYACNILSQNSAYSSYTLKLIKEAKMQGREADQIIWEQIYFKLKLAKKPSIKEVSEWMFN